MGDQNSILTAAEARHLLRRTGFGAPPKAVAKILKAGRTRGEAVDELLKFKPKKFQPGGKHKDSSLRESHDLWLLFMLKVKSALQEKLVLFWHDHFATSDAKVGSAFLMAAQNARLRAFCKGNFKDFVKAMNRDAATMEFLDTVRNRKHTPNENYGRELQELFTLGVKDFTASPGVDNYTQEDIVQIARAFTGWDYDDRGVAFFDDNRHDYMADFPGRGPKVIYQSTGGFGPGGRSFTVNGEGEAEIDTVIDIIFDHTDSAGNPTVARRTASRLLEYFAHSNPDVTIADAVVATSSFDTQFNIASLVRAILVHDSFYDSMAAAPFTASTKKSVKWPIDYVIGTLRMLGVRLYGRDQILEGGSYNSLLTHLDNMGQVLLDPPSVFGWDWETAWISSATLLARAGFARDATSARGRSGTSFKSEKLKTTTGGYIIDLSDAGDIVDAVTTLLGVDDQLTSAERTVLVDYVSDNGANTTLDLHDYATRQSKLHGLFALVLQSPAYQVH